MSQTNFNGKVHGDGPDELVIESGGKITAKVGAVITGITGVVAAGADPADVGALTAPAITDNSGGAAADGTIAVIRNDSLANLATDAAGAVKELSTGYAANRADIATLRTKVNALLAALRTAGVIA